MRKFFIFSALLILFLLVTESITWSQTISSFKGLTTAIFSMQYGIIKVYLPDDVKKLPDGKYDSIAIIEAESSEPRSICWK